MKKLSTLLWAAVMTLCCIQVSYAQDYRKEPLFKTNFDGLTALPSGMTNGRGGALTATNSSARGVAVANDMMTVSGGGSGGRGDQITFTPKFEKEFMSVDFDLKVNKTILQEANAHAFMIHLMGSNAVSGGNTTTNTLDGAGIISCVYLCGLDGMWHVFGQNMGELVLEPQNSVGPTLDWMTNMGTNVTYTAEVWYHFEFILNYTTQKVSITITDKNNPENAQTISDLAFISGVPVTDLNFMNVAAHRSGSTNSDFNVNMDNLQISELIPSDGKASVTVHYKDQDNNTVKPDAIIPDQEVNLNYELTKEDKTTFTKDGFYYAYDATATGDDYVLVVDGGVEITVKYKKTAITAGNYVWKGANSEFWDEIGENFTVGGNILAYQNGNGVIFSDESAPKDVNLTGNMDLGEGNIVITAEGYSIVGEGTLHGTGKIEINKSAKLGFINKMGEGLVELNGGTLEFTNVNTVSKIIMDQSAVLRINVGAEFKKTLEGLGGTLNIEAAQNNPYSLAITGFETVNLKLEQLGRANSTYTNNWNGTTFPDGTQINATTELVLDHETGMGGAGFAVGDNNFASTKVHLGNGVRLMRYYNQGPSSGSGTSTIKIGELVGDEGSTIEGGHTQSDTRTLTYEIGGLNTDATFAGVIKNFTGTTGADIVVPLYITKTGAGTWTLTGISPYSTSTAGGGVIVKEGTLKVDGQLGVDAIIPFVTVEAAATLAGAGSIGVLQTTVDGTITGNLTLGGSLSIMENSTTVINVNGSSIDKITTAGDININGGTLKIAMQGRPTTTGDFKILESGSDYIEGNFLTFEFPEPATDWSFNPISGVLTYTGEVGSGIAPIDYSKEIASMEYYDVTGRQVSKDCKGLVVVKVKYTDGSTGISKIFNK